MKVCWLIPSFWPKHGGIETFGWHLAQGLRDQGHELLIITDQGTPTVLAEEIVHGLQIVRLPVHQALAGRSPGQLLSLQRQLTTFAAAFQPDLLHLHLLGAVPMALFALRLHQTFRVLLLITSHDDLQNLRAGPDTLLGQCLQAASWITTDSQTFLADVLALAPNLAGHTSVIAPGVPPLTTPPQPLDPSTTQFLGLGRMAPEKGMNLAVAALTQVLQVYSTARLVLAGEGPAFGALQAQVAALGLEQHVVFAGQVTDVERTRLIDNSLAVLMPSRHREGFGLVALEAAQRSRAVIAAHAGALSETVKLLGNGLLIPQEDVPALAAAMCQLLSNPREAQRLGQIGRTSAEQRFRQDLCSTRYLALYQALIGTVCSSP